jgi:hypothetical protein
MKKSKRTSFVLFSIIALSGVIVPGMYMNAAKADVTPQQFADFGNLFTNPASVGSTLGGMIGGMEGFEGNVLGDIFTMIFSQVLNFNEQEMLPGQNVYVFSANANASTGTIPVHENQPYMMYAPYQDTNNNTYIVNINRHVDVTVTVKQQAQIVIILWDSDGSFVAAIKKVLAVVNEGITWAETHNASVDEIPQDLIESAAECITWMLVHINDIITGDEQIIFQPSYYWSYNITGSITETHTWYNAAGGGAIPGPAINATSWPAAAMIDPQMNYLKRSSANNTGTWSDTGFLFHLFQLWLQRFQISINMSKLGALIGFGEGGGNVTGDMLGNLLEGVDIKFSFTQHHLLGGLLFNDTNGDGVPTVDYTTTDYQYTDSSGIKNVTIPTSSELRYKIDIASSGSDWTPTMPYRDGSSVKWSVQFNSPSVRATPIGMDGYEAAVSGAGITMPVDYLKFGFSFTPSFATMNVPDADGNIVSQVNFGRGVVKLVQEFGEFNNGTLPAQIQGLDLAVLYFSHIFKFDFSFRNTANPTLYEETEWADRADGTIDFLGSGDTDYFGQIDIAGPNYTLANGSSYPASTSIVPFVMFNLTYNADRSVANDGFSISQGEAAFRQQSLYLGISSAWAFYCVSYPNWDGQALVHDPTFSIFMTLESNVPWAVILLIVTIGALVGGAVMIYLKKQGRY